MTRLLSYSVLIPCFNAARFVRDTLESVVIAIEVCQRLLTDPIFRPEIVCVDNGSSDDTVAVLNAFAKQISYMKVFSLKDNWGPGGGRNVCFAHSTGDFILFCDHDDFYRPERIALGFAGFLRNRDLLQSYQVQIPEEVDMDSIGAIYTGTECRSQGHQDDVNANVENFRLDYHLDGLMIRREVLWLMDLFVQTQISTEWYAEDIMLRDCLYNAINVVTIPLPLAFFSRSVHRTMHGVPGDGGLVKFVSNDGKVVYYRTKSKAHFDWLMQDRPRHTFLWLDNIRKKVQGGLVPPHQLRYFKKEFLATLDEGAAPAGS